MVKTRRSGENGEVEPENETLAPNDPESVSDEKVTIKTHVDSLFSYPPVKCYAICLHL